MKMMNKNNPNSQLPNYEPQIKLT